MLKMIKYRLLIYTLLFVSLFANIVFIGYFANKIYTHYVLNKSMDYWTNRHLYHKLLPNDSNEIVFVGDSKTQAFELSEHFKCLNVKNRGINGDNTLGLSKRMPEILSSYPCKIFIEIGINDLMRGLDVEITKKNYLNIVNAIQKYSPKTEVYIQSIMPCNRNIQNSRNKVFPKIVELNSFLEQLSKDKQFTYINIFKEFVLDNGLNPKYDCGDGLHISGQGYIKWADIIKPYIIEN